VLNLADGSNSLLDIAERAGLPFAIIADAADHLRQSGLLLDSESQPAGTKAKTISR
jgi:aminopeptidase-like protein